MRAAATAGVLCVVVLAGTMAGCRRNSVPSGQNGALASLTLYCGAGLRPAADPLIEAFESQHPIKVRVTYAGSEMLLAQIAANARGDLFMPGEESYVDRAVELGLADAETKRVAAYFVPVIFVQKGNPKAVRSLNDLTRDGLRIGLGDERSCAVGRHTLEILGKNHIPYAALAGNVYFKSPTVNELPLQIQLRNLDAVICWDASAQQFLNDGDIVTIPPAQNVPSRVPIVRLRSCVAPEAALEFIDFVTSEYGKDILRAEKYTVALPDTE